MPEHRDERSTPHDQCAFFISAGSRVSGFLRFLVLLASHPWTVRPLIVDPASEIPQADRRAAGQVR